MKSKLGQSVIILLFLLPVMVLSLPSSYGLISGNLEYHFTFDTIYAGDQNKVIRIELTSHSINDILVKWIGIQFDWMSSTTWIAKDMSANSRNITKNGGAADFGSFSFDVPTLTSIGTHILRVRIQFDEKHWYGWTYDDLWTETYTIQVHSLDEKRYNDLKPYVTDALEDASAKTYLSPGAKDLLQQAQDTYNDATAYAARNQWLQAYSALSTTQNLIRKIQDEETRFLLLIIGAIVVLVIGILIYRTRRKTPSPQPISPTPTDATHPEPVLEEPDRRVQYLSKNQ